jgi:general secretion pathway protein G
MKQTDLNPRDVPKRDAGFSYVEMMVVVFVMGLLSTVIFLNVAPSSEKSRVVKAQSDVAALESALEMYSLDMVNYPAPDVGLQALKGTPSATGDSAARPGGYLKRLREDPWGNAYHYNLPGVRSGGAYDVFSAGPDGTPGNQDDIGNWS